VTVSTEAPAVSRERVTPVVSRVWRWVVTARYAWVALAAALLFLVRYHLHVNDYLYFEYFGRTALGRPRFDHGIGSLLHFYVDYPGVQVGPPAMITAVPMQALPFGLGNRLSAGLMMAALLPCLFLVERTARNLGAAPERLRPLVLVGGLLLVPVWGDLAVFYMHWDDVGIFLLATGAFLALSRDRAVLAAVLLGTAMAAKPWAIGLAPVLLVVGRARLPMVALVWIFSFLAWWAPFLISEPSSFSSLSSHRVPVQPGSVWHLLGVHGNPEAKLCQSADYCLYAAYGWMRGLQLATMTLLAAGAVLRGRWLAAPLVALAARAALDPQVWLYYAAGPVLMAFVWEAVRGHRFPRWTCLAIACLCAPVVLDAPRAEASLRLLLALVVTGWFVVRPAAEPATRPEPA
jgi:hypothetical protein